MWEFIAFVLFGVVMVRLGVVLGYKWSAERGLIDWKQSLYRVTKIEDKE